MPQFKVKVQRKIYFSEESGYGVFMVAVQGRRETTVIVGNLFDVNEGDFLEIEGDYFEHPKFGKQIKVQSFQARLPEDKEGIIKYLASDRFKGIGPKSAEKIAQHFGKDTFKILENHPERLREVKGLRRTVIDDVRQNFADNRTVRDLSVKLTPYGIGQETVYKIFKEFGDSAFGVLEQNPYVLIEKIRGVAFKTADTIAKSFGVANNDSYRIKAGIDFLVSLYETRNGDLYIEESELVNRTASLLDVNDQEIAESLGQLVAQDKLMRESIPEPVIMGYKNYIIEKMIARYLHTLNDGAFEPGAVSVDFDFLAKRTKLEFTDEQKTAVRSAVANRITIITGGPGTGKTTIIRGVIDSFEKAGKTVLVAAPTGRAAKRIEEATMYAASTIHRMLKISPEKGGFVHNENNPLKADAVIVDEFSMVDFFIFYSLLKAISQHTRLIIIGDKDQLPSVGPGNVLRDIIACDYFEIIYLNRNFRQTADSLIIENAYRINSGDQLIFKPYADDLDFVFIRVNSEAQALEKVLRIIEYYIDDYNYNSPDLQVLTPMYRGDAGIDSINLKIQDKFNTQPPYVKKEKFSFKRWDKVMQLKNNYEKEIFNGEQGIVAEWKKDEKKLLVDFDGHFIEYNVEELDELTLSYAVSVHKSQGSEYDMVVLVLLPSHSIMLNRELFYTAATRARKKLILISDPQTVQRAVMNSSPSQRKTLLPQRLRDIFDPAAPGPI